MSIISRQNYKPNPWYKNLYYDVVGYFKWNAPVTRHIYSWYLRRYGKQFRKWSAPLIKNVMPPIHPSEFVNIQPMSVPPCSVFYMDYVKNKKKWYQFWKK